MSETTPRRSRSRPSERWTSYDDWNYGTMKQRLESFMASFNKPALKEHVELIVGSFVSMSEPFSAGQYWCCFEIVAPDDRLVIARVRLPKHPDANNISDDAEAYVMHCEAATMAFVRDRLPAICLPALYAFEGPGSDRAARAGAPYMLMGGIYGNSLQDADLSVYNLPSPATGPRPLATATLDGLTRAGPFASARDYLLAVAEARLKSSLQPSQDASRFTRLGHFIFHDIVRNTELFASANDPSPFPLSHMDMGPQNLLVDADLNIISVIDWEMAQSSPWSTFHYPMPIPLLKSDTEIAEIVADPTHLAHPNTVRQARAREIYREGFAAAAKKMGQRPPVLIAQVLEGRASRIYGTAEKVGVFEGWEETFLSELFRLGYGLVGEAAEKKLHELETEMGRLYPET